MGDQQEEGLTMNNLLSEVQNTLDKFKLEDDGPPGADYYSPYANLEKAAVLQEARCFHDPTAVRENPRKCCTVIAQLLHLTNTGQYLNSAEATEVFFGVTKLFMSDDASLRRMVYLFIKDVAETCDPDDVIIVTSSLTKDMTCDVDLYRANALRVLARIVDAAMLGAIERYVKQAVVDSSGQVSSAALVSATHLFERNVESAAIVKRWISETTEAIASPNEMVQFHAMQLLYQIKKHDRLGMQKLVTQFSQRNTLKSPLALVLLVRYTAKLLNDEVTEGRMSGTSFQNGSTYARSGYAFLEASLRHKSEMVVYEAAKAICALPNIEPQELSPAINVLQLFLSSSKPTVRFAAIKTVSQVAVGHPRMVSKCNEDLEALIADANRSIATLAITTLLKTGSENSIDRLLKQISVFLSEIPDEYKITIVRSLQRLCLTYPAKHRVLVGFLSNFLREEGGFDFKRSIVNSIISLIKQVPETTESSLLHLCEFIEDCEFTMLSTQILHLLGELGPGTHAPARYIRFIYNRVILENSAVRASAVAALSKFAARCPSLRSSIMTLLKRSLDDEDDETRDRASVAVNVLKGAMDEFPYVAPDEDADPDEEPVPDVPQAGDPAAFVLLQGLPMSFDRLDRSIRSYVKAPTAMESAEQLTFSALPIVEEYEEPESADQVDDLGGDAALMSTVAGEKEAKKEVVDPAAAVYAIPELASLGRVFRSSPPTELSEEETEYVVRCVKHVMPEHIILQFLIQNTVEDQRLVNCTVAIEGDSECFEVAGDLINTLVHIPTHNTITMKLFCVAAAAAALATVQAFNTSPAPSGAAHRTRRATIVMDGKANAIRDRISTVNNTKKITSAMKLVAAAKVRRAQDSVLATRPFSETLQSVFGGLIDRLGGEAADLPLLTVREVNKVTLVVITGDRGLCGGYNSFMIKKAEARFKELKAQGIECDMILIGKKGSQYFQRREYPIRAIYDCGQNPDSKQALAISEEIINSFLSGETDAVELLYTKFVSLISSAPSVRTLVPFSASEISQQGDEVFQLTSSGGDFGVERKELDAAEPQDFPNDMIFEQDPLQIVNSILPLYLNGQILRTLQESVASELAARMQSMQSASDNASALAKQLNQEYNRARQAAVTQEILEIVSGAQALE